MFLNKSKSILKPIFLNPNNCMNTSTKFFFFTNFTKSKIPLGSALPSSFSTFSLINKNINLTQISKKNFTIIDITNTGNNKISHFHSQNENLSAIKKFVALDVTNLTDNPGAKKLKRRVGRGPGSSKGKTSARGHKIRGEPYRHFEGGQTNVFRRLPKRAFRMKKFKDEFAYINIQKILYLIHKGRLDPTKPIGVKEIFYAGGVSKVVDGIKLLSRGAENLKHFPKLDITVQSATEKAIKAIKEHGGSITISHGTRLYNRFLLKPAKFTRELVEPYPSFKRVRRMLTLRDKGALTRFKEPLWMKENDLNDRIKRLKERLSKLKNAELLPEIPADKSPRTVQKIRPVRKTIYKKYNFESKL